MIISGVLFSPSPFPLPGCFDLLLLTLFMFPCVVELSPLKISPGFSITHHFHFLRPQLRFYVLVYMVDSSDFTFHNASTFFYNYRSNLSWCSATVITATLGSCSTPYVEDYLTPLLLLQSFK